jgi:predicted nuclease of predicted toxin-antitoxin system
MRFFIDECLSPQNARELNETGLHVAMHPLDFGGRGEADHNVLARCIADDPIIVTQNARDFRALVAAEEIHPGLIILPCVGPARSKALLDAAIAHLKTLGDPMNAIVNHVLEIDHQGNLQMYPLPR